ncbi:zinc metalloprotease HtpX [Desulfitispora alkaliphila]|uniref:zinc metalloprotease HtpX n=1 Tax=Desulfitispora alkaliphila TaxID=622674 RepID=UPI003D2491D8
MIVLTVIFIVAGNLIAGDVGVQFAFVFAIVMNFGTYWFSDKLALKMTKSRPLSEEEAPWLYDMTRRLCERANMPMPKLYLMDSPQPNAFATGRNPKNGVVAVTSGLVRMMDREELEGVVAHELAHIKNRDILISTIAAVLAGALTMIAQMGRYRAMFGRGNRGGNAATAVVQILAVILAPIAALLVRSAISRSREYEADKVGAEISGNPKGLASALMTLERGAQRAPMQVNEAASHMFIINPLTRDQLSSMFSTHPPIKDRVARLEKLER